MVARSSRRSLFVFVWAAVAGPELSAQELELSAQGRELSAQGRELAGFGSSTTVEQLRYEAALLEGIDPAAIAEWARALGARPHVAGTPAQQTTRDLVVGWLEAAGLDSRSDTLIAYLPQPLFVRLERLHPSPVELALDEPVLAEVGPPGRDPFPVFSAYSGSGQAEGEVVYANYGLADDYRALDSLGVEVAGKVVVARYGRSFRGIKAREAEQRGAVGLILYTDPASDGYRVGDVYPEGPMRPGFGVQRGSILIGSGDPSTPDWPSLPGARRVPEDQMSGVARIPVLPAPAETAGELLRHLAGPGAPREWQGALPFHYHTGPGPVRARLSVETEREEQALHAIFNTVAVLPGSDLPEEWVVLGAHRDAWGPGALDNVSGTTSVVAAGVAFGALAARGLRPRRTLVFATWDAEEWGLIGSTEWVEAHASSVKRSVVAYLNQDSPAGGPNFSASATPELKPLVRAAAASVEDPSGEGTVLERWLRRTAGDPVDRIPRVGDLGGGSDHVPFVQALGIPGAAFGFGGRGGVYHSAYDAADWMERFGDAGYRRHAATASVLAVMAARLANAEILPYDFPTLAADLEKRLGEVMEEVRRASSASEVAGAEEALMALRGEVLGFAAETARFDSASARALEDGVAPAALEAANAHIREAAAAFVSEGGLPGLPHLRQLLYATDPNNGYATLALPSLRLSLRDEDGPELGRRLAELRDAVAGASASLTAARRALERSGPEEG